MVQEIAEINGNGISKEELMLILQLKVNVKDVLPQTILSKSEEDQRLYLVRWIRARENNLEKATEMLRNHLQWRVEINADEVTNKLPHPFFTENYPILIAGVDRKGQPVVCVPLGEWDFRKVIRDEERLAEFDHFTAYTFETYCRRIESEHKKRAPGQPPITQVTFLFDVKNYPYGQLVKYSAMKKLLDYATVYEKHFPEILYRAIFINCPSYFGLFSSLLKPVLATKTMGKLTFHSSMAKWQEEINDVVDPAIIPERYGGTLIIS